MTVAASDGPLITVGTEAALGSATGTQGATGAPTPYISGSSENPDAGPNVFFAGNAFKDMRYRYLEGGGYLQPGGYPNQAVGFIDNLIQAVDFVPSAIAADNIAALQAPTANTALTLVAASGAGITVTTAAITVLATGKVVPAGVCQIDSAPAWSSYGASGAIRGWTAAAAGRAISLTSGADLHTINFTVAGYDLYGYPQTEVIAGPNNDTVNGKKGWKWISSITPSATNAGTVSVGTADIFEFPLRADRFSLTSIWWNETVITANTGFVAADLTSPATNATGSVRGTYAVQSASDGTKRLVVNQRVFPAYVASQTGVFGVTPA